MRINEEKIEAINKSYRVTVHNQDKFKLNILNGVLKGTSVFRDNWEICSLSDLSTMIEELTRLRDVIETETGIKF